MTDLQSSDMRHIKWCQRHSALSVPSGTNIYWMEIYVKISLMSIFSLFFPVFQSWFCHIHWFTHVAASNTATDDVTN